MFYKQLLLSLAISLTTITTTQAQYRPNAGDNYPQKFYIKAGVQYAMPIMGNIGLKGNAMPSPVSPRIDTFNKKVSFGEGFWAAASVGYFITPNFGIEGGIQVGLSQPEAIFEYNDGLYQLHQENKTSTRSQYAVFINPSLVYRVPFNRFCIFGKTGVVIPINTVLSQSFGEHTYYPGNQTDFYDYEFQLRNKVNLGFSCGFGAEYRFAENIALSVDLNIMALTVDTKEREMTSFKINGKEQIDNMTPEQKIIQYSNDAIHTIDYWATQPQLSTPISFSNANAHVGFVIYF